MHLIVFGPDRPSEQEYGQIDLSTATAQLWMRLVEHLGRVSAGTVHPLSSSLSTRGCFSLHGRGALYRLGAVNYWAHTTAAVLPYWHTAATVTITGDVFFTRGPLPLCPPNPNLPLFATCTILSCVLVALSVQY